MIAPFAALLPPDELASPAGLALARAGTALGGLLLTSVPDGPHRDSSWAHLVQAVQAAYAGMATATVPADPDPADAPVPYALTGQAAADDADPALVLDVGVWRLGLMRSGVHPLTRLAGLVLAEACGPSGYIPDAAQPTLWDLSTRTGLHLHQLHTHLGELVAGRWVSRHAAVEHGVTRARYQLRLPNPACEETTR